jgi:RNase adapter protein RapZ
VADVLLIAGLSGAGRSQAADDLEDLGWFVVDNMPIALIDKVVELAGTSANYDQQLALVVGSPSHQTDAIGVVHRLRESGHRVRVLFLDASTPELVKRYGQTRRKHPLSSTDTSVEQAINRERVLLEPVKGAADLVIDTTQLNVHQLKFRIIELFSDDGERDSMQLSIVSFGYKHGVPIDVDLVFDVRFLPNPHWDEDLRPLSGLDEPVRDFVLAQDLAGQFMERLCSLFELLLPAYRAEGKSYLTVAIGCTGGKHRSVAIAESFAVWLRQEGHHPRVTHRDMHR